MQAEVKPSRRVVLSPGLEIISKLNESEHSPIYLCISTETGIQEVAKIIYPAEITDRTALKLFSNEVLTANRLNNPYIVKTKRYLRGKDFFGYLMEYVEAGNLTQRSKQFTFKDGQEQLIPLSPLQVVNWLLDIALGLQAIHSIWVCHRDLKPDNILVTDEGHLKLCDFGVSVPNSFFEDVSKDLFNDQLFGTLDYMCPEYLLDGIFNERSDLYSLGLIGFELLTGSKPFEEKIDGSNEQPMEMLRKRVLEKPPAVNDIRKDCPPKLNRLIAQLLEIDPAKRYKSSTELVFILTDLKKELDRGKIFNFSSFFNKLGKPKKNHYSLAA
jgi:serine/threonine protein kinase